MTAPPPPAPAQPGTRSAPMKYTIDADEEQRSYDFLNARSTLFKKTTMIESTAHLVKGCLGAGMLGIHYAFMKVGLWTAVTLNIMFGIYLSYCIHILVKTAQTLYYRLHIPAMSYSDLAEVSVGSCCFPRLRKFDFTFRVLVDTMICIDLFGSCCCYEIFIGQTIKQLIENVPDAKIEGLGNSPDLRIYILIIAIPIILICLITGLKYLAPFSIFANLLILISVFTTIYYALKREPNFPNLPSWKSWSGLVEFLGVSVFSMEGIGVSLAIENNMAKPLRFGHVVLFGMSIVVMIVTLTGFFGYWGWGEYCLSSVTLNFPMGEILPLAVKGSMAVVVLVTFALNFWVPFNIVWHYLRKRHPENKHWLWVRLYRTIHVIIITLLAVAFPKMGSFMGFLGSFCLSNMGFVFPAFIDTIVIWEKPGLGAWKWRLWRNVVIIISGLIFLFFGSWVNGKSLFFD